MFRVQKLLLATTTTKMAVWWCLVSLLGFAMAAVRVGGQSTDTNSLGFISIDCGLADDHSYVDSTTNITFISDAQFIDTGINRNISGAYATDSMAKTYLNVRSFPNGNRNCYTITSVTPGFKYLIRASFLYGNYDGLNKNPIFDLYLGVNLWHTINISDPAIASRTEVTTAAIADFISVCLVNTGQGTPFISALLLRPLNSILYPAVNASRSLVLVRRVNMGPTDQTVRYPNDPHDRIWEPLNNEPLWTEISTNSTVENTFDDLFEVPSAVMQTAVIPVNTTKLLIYFTPQPGFINAYYINMHFAELLPLSGNESRQFNIYINGDLWFAKPFTPQYLISNAVYSVKPLVGFSKFNMSIEASSNSTLPPILNAMEVFSTMSNVNVPSDGGDVDAMMEIKTWYGIKRNWIGDPCSPKAYSWDGLNCTNNLTGSLRITTLNLSSSGLTGGITNSFASLEAIQFLDLSYNNLTGVIPAVLAELSSLTFLDLTGNQLNGSIPSDLIKKSQSGLLTLRIQGNPHLCANGTSCEVASTTKKKIATSLIVILCVVPVVLVTLLVFFLIRLKKRKPQEILGRTSKRPWNEELPKQIKDQQVGSLELENRRFTYIELQNITNNFGRVLGEGGFGTVYHGYLEDGTQVAVKMRSQSSSQGTKEFLAEAQHLTRVHHRYLVSMVGYCKDGDYLALVYEYMSQGTLQEHLRGQSSGARVLSWGQRLNIALEAALGLEYLHEGCMPALIHRDVKTANILLSKTLEAKIADFGLSKAFQSNIQSHVSTAVMGTPGYLDPEYYSSFQLSEKSDVHSFGVVLLELITGRPPIQPGPDHTHIAPWVRQSLTRGDIEDVIDTKLQGDYDVNSVWKVTDVALRCTVPTSHQRPAMSEVVMHLKESLELETARNRTDDADTSRENLHLEMSKLSQNSLLDAEHVAGMTLPGGPSAR